ncbi:hypothetical protein COY28_06635 [Candidatus Woesearchaeota archaeon CG_4_10_14_0_2_um_filter_57_5]|nr:MAG: hypothetical protein AUJ68_00555 [Candidatus Woesearchaeota archaeon CG1_02_57_44]PIZ49131.1 MAG: hypothetical protein COY28_06635 [Candidatus Woesearchaeota archaeon CG_4_10_14_0_2_um_filter_57_5]
MARIMIVDDNKDIVQTMQDLLRDAGHTTAATYGGKDFLVKVQKFHPDLIVMDVMMPGMDFKDLLEQFLQLQLSAAIILVTVVRFSSDEGVVLRKRYRVVDYIKKPFQVKDLLASVKKHTR